MVRKHDCPLIATHGAIGSACPISMAFSDHPTA
jgi:hypothetical protein